ncbi:hypothetical protein D3C85_1613310 [compost metagenome]
MMPVTISEPWMPANQKIWHSSTESRIAGRESEAETSGSSRCIIACGRIIPVCASINRFNGCSVPITTSTGIKISKERATPVGTSFGRRMVTFFSFSHA